MRKGASLCALSCLAAVAGKVLSDCALSVDSASSVATDNCRLQLIFSAEVEEEVSLLNPSKLTIPAILRPKVYPVCGLTK